MRAKNDFVDRPILMLLIEKLLHKSVEQHDVAVVIPPVVKVPASLFKNYHPI
jgi:hypothetical protein